MAFNPKLEFYKFQLKSSDGNTKTFRDFAIEELKGAKSISNDDAFKKCFEHFIKTIGKEHAKSPTKKMTITIIDNPRTNPYIKLKPSPTINKHIIAGVINGGPYDKDAIVSSIANKEKNRKLGRDNSILLPYFVFIYLPSDYHEGLFAIHSNSVEESVTAIFRSYISNLFRGDNYNKAILQPFCPQSFQDEFRKGAIIKTINFSTTIVENTHSTDPIQQLLQEYTIRIEATPKDRRENAIPLSEAKKVFNFFEKKIFKSSKNKEVTLDNFTEKSVVAENDVTKNTKVFQLNQEDDNFVPVVKLQNRIRIIDGSPDFEELRKYCLEIFENEILTEIRPDLNAKKIN